MKNNVYHASLITLVALALEVVATMEPVARAMVVKKGIGKARKCYPNQSREAGRDKDKDRCPAARIDVGIISELMS